MKHWHRCQRWLRLGQACPFSGVAEHQFVPEPVFGWRSPISPWVRNRVGEKGGALEDVVRKVAPHFAPPEAKSPREAKESQLRLVEKYELKEPVEAATLRVLERIEDASEAMPAPPLRARRTLRAL